MSIVSNTCHPAPCYWNSDKVFLLLSDQYCNPEQGFKPGSSSECLLEFDTRSKPLGHHGRLVFTIIEARKIPWCCCLAIRLIAAALFDLTAPILSEGELAWNGTGAYVVNICGKMSIN